MNDKKNIDNIFSTVEKLRWEINYNVHDSMIEALYTEAARISDRVVTRGGEKTSLDFDQKLDRLVTSKWLGFPIMILLLAIVFWLTITGANVPSSILANLLIDKGHPILKNFADNIGLPWWLSGLLIDGMYLTTAWVISVMLPPMAIFFPLFTFLEDFGYLPRVAFNMDGLFRKVGAHGKQALTMSMGFGCNAAGVVATRIIDSPRERLIAIITNNFSLCNGRWPMQILIATIFIGGLVPSYMAGFISAVAVVSIALTGILLSLVTSWFLSKTILRGTASTFSLELPPYRPPRLLQILYTSLIDRTIIILWRAVIFAFPAGLLIWLLANIHLGSLTLAEHLIKGLNPAGVFFGLNGIILLSYVIAIPANEIVIPSILMLTVLSAKMTGVGGGAGVIFELNSIEDTANILRAGGWTLLTAVNLMLFSLVHNPCSTTIYTIWKETRNAKWTTVATFLPIGMGLLICFITTQIWHLF